VISSTMTPTEIAGRNLTKSTVLTDKTRLRLFCDGAADSAYPQQLALRFRLSTLRGSALIDAKRFVRRLTP